MVFRTQNSFCLSSYKEILAESETVLGLSFSGVEMLFVMKASARRTFSSGHLFISYILNFISTHHKRDDHF